MGFLDKAKSMIGKKDAPVEDTPEEEFLDETTGVSDEASALMEFSESAKRETPSDILSTLNIPETFELSRDVFFPEDLEKVQFHVQAPKGYDMGEVSAFVAQTQSTVETYFRLLKKRNEHVAQLATTIDRLKVSLNNLRFQTELDAGVSVMSDGDDLESQLLEEQLKSRRLEDEIKALREKGAPQENEDRVRGLENDNAMLFRENTLLKDENSDLRSTVAMLREKYEHGDENGFSAPLAQESNNSFDDDFELPDFDTIDEGSFPGSDSTESAFATPGESFDEFVGKNSDADTQGSLSDTTLRFIDEDDEDDVVAQQLRAL